MNIIKTYNYTFGTMYRIISDDGDMLQWKDDDTCLFGYVLSGILKIIDSPIPEAIGYTYENSKLLDPTIFVGKNTYQTIGKTEWVCAHVGNKNPLGYFYQLLEVDQSAILPTGWGFFVVSGSVLVDGISATEDNYFRPRQTDLSIEGTGTLILIQNKT